MLATVTTTPQTLTAATAGASVVANEMGLQLQALEANSDAIVFGNQATVTAAAATTAGFRLESGKDALVAPAYAPSSDLLWVVSVSGTQSLIWDKVKR